MSESKILNYLPFPLISGDYDLKAEKAEACKEPPKIDAKDLELLELFYMALGLDISASNGVEVAYRGGNTSLAATEPLQKPFNNFTSEYKYADIYNAIRQSFSPSLRSHFDAKVGAIDPANTDKKIQQTKAVLGILKNPPAGMTANDKIRLELFFQTLALDIQADGTTEVSYKRGDESLGFKGAMQKPITDFTSEYKYASIYDSIRQTFSPAFRTYFAGKVSGYDPANTGKKIQQIKVIQAMLATTNSSFCFSIEPPKGLSVPKDKETEIVISAKNGLFPEKPVVKFTLDGKPTDKVKLAADPELSADRKKLKIKVIAPATEKPFGINISDSKHPFIKDSLDNAFSVSSRTWMETANDFIHHKLGLQAEVSTGGTTTRRPGMERMPLEDRAMAERSEFNVGLKLKSRLLGKNGIKHSDKWEVEGRGSFNGGWGVSDHSQPSSYEGGVGLSLKRNIRDKYAPEVYIDYEGAKIDQRWPNPAFASGIAHSITTGAALNLALRNNKLKLRTFVDYRQIWYDLASETYGYPFNGRSQMARGGASAEYDLSDVVKKDKKGAKYIPTVSVKAVAYAGRQQFPYGSPSSIQHNEVPMRGGQGEAAVTFDKHPTKASVAVGTNVSVYETWRARTEVYAKAGVTIPKGGRIEVAGGYEKNPNQFILNREGSRTYGQVTYTPPEEKGRISALSVTGGVEQYQTRERGFWQGMVRVSVRLHELIFGKKKPQLPRATEAVKPEGEVAPPVSQPAKNTISQYISDVSVKIAAKDYEAAIEISTKALDEINKGELPDAGVLGAQAPSLLANRVGLLQAYRAQAYLSLGKMKEAKQDFEKVVAQNEKISDVELLGWAHYGLSQAKAALNQEYMTDKKKAGVYFSKYKQVPAPVSPNEKQLARYVEEACKGSANPQACISSVKSTITFGSKKEDIDMILMPFQKQATEKTVADWKKEGDAKLAKDDYKGAIADYTEALKKAGRRQPADLHESIGLALFFSGDTKGARRSFKRAIAINRRGRHIAYLNLGLIDKNENKMPAAIANLNNAINSVGKNVSANKEILARCYNARAEAKFELSKKTRNKRRAAKLVKEARQDYTKACEFDSKWKSTKIEGLFSANPQPAGKQKDLVKEMENTSLRKKQ